MPEETTQYIEPVIRVKPLARRVLVVVKPGDRGDDWDAYVDAVAGKRHNDEWQAVMEQGIKLERHLAVAMFPMFDPETYRK